MSSLVLDEKTGVFLKKNEDSVNWHYDSSNHSSSWLFSDEACFTKRRKGKEGQGHLEKWQKKEEELEKKVKRVTMLQTEVCQYEDNWEGNEYLNLSVIQGRVPTASILNVMTFMTNKQKKRVVYFFLKKHELLVA